MNKCIKQIIWILTSVVFYPLSLVYWLITWVRNVLYDRKILKTYSLPGRVISIGNIDVGGTGKTPISIRIARFLEDRGKKVAILTRGYKSGLKSDESVYIKDGLMKELSVKDSSVIERICPDEARLESYMLKDSYIIVGANRIEAAKLFMEKTGITPEYWILDDGFQHRKIKRDKNILLVNAKYPISYGVLPWGKRREGCYSIKRADFILFTRADSNKISDKFKRVLEKYNKDGRAIVFKLEDHYLIEDKNIKIDDSLLKKSNVLVMCGISGPQRFIDMLEDRFQSINIVEKIVVRDHFEFSKDMLSRFDRRKDPSKEDVVITTEKDYFRNPKFFKELRMKVVLVPLCVELEDEIIEKYLI